jgi:hypothetical protein
MNEIPGILLIQTPHLAGVACMDTQVSCDRSFQPQLFIKMPCAIICCADIAAQDSFARYEKRFSMIEEAEHTGLI